MTALLTALAPGAALAHPGHGVVSDPVLHLLAEPEHAIPLLAILAGGVALFAARHFRARVERRR